jgi:plastocyanin
MRKLTITVGIALLTIIQAACTDKEAPTSPLTPTGTASASKVAVSGGSERLVTIFDACDGPTFSAAHIECDRTSGVTLQDFIGQLTAHGSAGAWHFAPSSVNAFVGQTLLAANRGGEAHTFTEVEHFGGGIVPLLNQLSGNPVPAPECLALTGADFIPPGGTHHESVEDEGTELYQCCIHPWMRATVTAKKG